MRQQQMKPAVRVSGREEAACQIQWVIRAAQSMWIVKQPNVFTMRNANVMQAISELAAEAMYVTAKRQNVPAFVADNVIFCH